jgi:hypothetical protein
LESVGFVLASFKDHKAVVSTPVFGAGRRDVRPVPAVPPARSVTCPPPSPPPKFDPEITEAVRLAIHPKGPAVKVGPSASRHVFVRNVIAKQLKKQKLELSAENVAKVAGCDWVKSLLAIPSGQSPVAPLAELDAAVKATPGNDKWMWGKQLACIAAAWCLQLSGDVPAVVKTPPKPAKPAAAKPKGKALVKPAPDVQHVAVKAPKSSAKRASKSTAVPSPELVAPDAPEPRS